MLPDFISHLATVIPSVSIHPVTNKASVFPSCTFQVRDGLREQFYVGSEGLRNHKITLNLYCKSYAELQTLKETLTTSYHGFSGVIGSSTITRILISSSVEDTEELSTNDTLYRCILELEILD